MKTEVQITPYRKDLNLSVYYFLKQGLNPMQVCKRLGMKKSALSYHLKKLKLNGYIKKVSYGVWKVTQKEVQITPKGTTKNTTLKKPKFRGHAFQFTLKIPTIKGWQNRHLFLKKNNISIEWVGLGKTIPRIELPYYKRKYKVWLCNNSLIIYLTKKDSFLRDQPEQALQEALYRLNQIITKLENLLFTSFKINRRYNVKVKNHHYSLIENEIAQHFNLTTKGAIHFKDEQGKAWSLIDNSHNLNELEFIDRDKAVPDSKVFNKVMNQLRDRILDKHEEAIQDVVGMQGDSMGLIKSISDKQMNMTLALEQVSDNLIKLARRVG
jgi:DNA-binding transcriptional ArsR family regulator|tara:strand:+ start:154 stop:1125 length:972 start_codon:yes stop_codon:yes gene_type:complete